MAKEYSPFTPGIPVPIDFFIGRAREVGVLVEKARAACAGRLERAFVYGERGIGKSSLCHIVRVIAEKEHNILGIHVFLGGVTSLQEMARRIFDRLLKDSVDRPWHAKIKDFLGKHVKQVGLFGISVEFGADERELNQLVNDFPSALRNLMQQLKEEKKGLMIILDDLNGLANSSDFANWLKSLVDEIATSDKPLPMTLVLVGLAERRTQIFQQQPSLARAFDPIEIKKLSLEETRDFYKNAFKQVGGTIDDGALGTLCKYSGGYPVLAHEIGDAVFKIDMDNHISEEDAVSGVLIAANVIGQKYIEPQVYEAMRSQKYHSILRKLARTPVETQFRRKDVISNLTNEEAKVFDNFLQKMKNLGVLMEDKDIGGGGYKFTSELQYLFIWLQARTQKESKGTT